MAGCELIALGVIGEYLGRVFNEVKGRPLYLVESVSWSLAGGARHMGQSGAEHAEARRGRNLLRVGRFSVVGILNTLVDVAVFITLVKLFAVPLVAANLFAFAVALANSYVVNRLWTLAGFRRTARPREPLALRPCNIAGALLATAALSLLVASACPSLAAKAPVDRGEHGLELPHHGEVAFSSRSALTTVPRGNRRNRSSVRNKKSHCRDHDFNKSPGARRKLLSKFRRVLAYGRSRSHLQLENPRGNGYMIAMLSFERHDRGLLFAGSLLNRSHPRAG